MHKGKPRACLRAALLGIAVTIPAAAAHAVSVARVDFSVGDVVVTTPQGAQRSVAKGSELNVGERIQTNGGRAQLRFVDGGYISLQPQTDFKIDEYEFEDKADGVAKALLSLTKGGLRTITGLVGRRKREDYRLQTAVATIGIRGTEFSVTYGNSINVTVGEGAIEACNAAGCLVGSSGQTLRVESINTLPVLVSRKTELPPAPLPRQQFFYARTEDLGPGGDPVVLRPVQVVPPLVVVPPAPLPPPVIPLANGPGTLLVASVTTGGAFSGGVLGGTLTFAPTGELTQFIDFVVAANNYTAGTSTDFGADGIIAWGRWNTGFGAGGQALTTMNYITVLTANPVTVPSIVRGYVSFASTAPVVTAGGAIVAVGAPNSVTGTLNVNFPSLAGGGTLTYNLNVPVAGQTFTLNGSAGQFSGTAFLGTTSTITSTGAGCTPSCTGNIPFGDAIQGVFTGSAAQRAGANYGFTSQAGQVSGAVVFK